MKTSFKRPQRGISLIEALVALAVMAFGMLGVVGIQTTLRSNADLSRQSSEALRIAQEEVERLRSFAFLDTADAGGLWAFDQIASAPPVAVAASNSNTTFTLQTSMAEVEADDPRIRQLVVQVGWQDRRGEPQRVVLSTLIAGLAPDFGALAAMRTDRGPLQQPLGRHAAIPRGAILDESGTTSSFTPPGAAVGTRWVFDNVTGLITRVCTGVAEPFCTDTTRLLLSGNVVFATGGAPTSAEAENPVDAAIPLSMEVVTTVPGGSAPCFLDTAVANRRSYFCAVPVSVAQRWSGRVVFAGPTLASAANSVDDDRHKVCRYTPDLFNHTGSNPPTGVSDVDHNARHPFRYIRVTQPLANKNFLVITAGNEATPFACPTDDPSTAVMSDTFIHQPAP